MTAEVLAWLGGVAVVVICLLVVARACLAGMRVQEEMKRRLAGTQEGWIRAALDAYHGDHGRYPAGTADEVLGTLMGSDARGENPRGVVYLARLMIKDGRPVDAWGRAFRISPALPGERPVIFSSGRNRTVDTGKAGG